MQRQVNLRASNGEWVTAEGGGGGAVNANRTTPLQWETFTLEAASPISGLAIGAPLHIRTWDGFYVTAEFGPFGRVDATRPAAAQWETFVPHSPGKAVGTPLQAGLQLQFSTFNGHWLTAEGGGGGTVVANRTAASLWETFVMADTSIPPLTNTKFIFTLDGFRIDNTRSLHTDTDFVALAVGHPASLSDAGVRSMGDLNNGYYPLAMSSGPVDCSSQDLVVGFLIQNQGHGTESDIEAALRAAVAKIPTDFPTDVSIEAILEYAGEVLAKEVLTLGLDIIFANCDGVVAADLIQRNLPTLREQTAAGPHHESKQYPGYDSATGCGSNSSYTVFWTISAA